MFGQKIQFLKCKFVFSFDHLSNVYNVNAFSAAGESNSSNTLFCVGINALYGRNIADTAKNTI